MSAQTAPAVRAHIQASETKPIVVKLGGSVVRSGELETWLTVIAAAKKRIVIVPGGGALADEVRGLQQDLGFGDRAAHRMALLAMDQLALALSGLRPGFEVGDTEEALRRTLDDGLVAVWAPYRLLADRTEIPETWNVTSDSLALWLAGRLGAERLILIKSILRKGAGLSAGVLANDGVIDAAFPGMLEAASFPVTLLGRGEQAAFRQGMEQDGSCGAVVCRA
jgi:aspartokinase-like uncharacterized kinase